MRDCLLSNKSRCKQKNNFESFIKSNFFTLLLYVTSELVKQSPTRAPKLYKVESKSSLIGNIPESISGEIKNILFKRTSI